MDDDSPDLMIPRSRPPPHGLPTVAQNWTYQTGRTQYPLVQYPMQTAMGPIMWAGRGLGKWEPLRGHGVDPAAPYLSPMREAAHIRTQPMHNELGYQIVLMRDNGVPIGGTPQTTPQYVTSGPIQAGYMSFVQPIMRAEQMPLGGGRPILANPSLGGRSGPWTWNIRQTLRGSGVYGGPFAWPYIEPPSGYKVIGTDEGGWPIFSELPQAPARYPTETEEPIQRAAGNPGDPLEGTRLAMAAALAGTVAGGTMAALSSFGSDSGNERPSRGSSRPNPNLARQVVMFNPCGMSRNPLRNPALWPFVLGAAAIGGAAYGIHRCAPGERLRATDKQLGGELTRSLQMNGCFKEFPWRARRELFVPGVDKAVEERDFATKKEAMKWLYPDELQNTELVSQGLRLTRDLDSGECTGIYRTGDAAKINQLFDSVTMRRYPNAASKPGATDAEAEALLVDLVSTAFPDACHLPPANREIPVDLIFGDLPKTWSGSVAALTKYLASLVVDPTPNPSPGYGLARQFRADKGDCRPVRVEAEKETAISLGNTFFSVRHRAPSQEELYGLANQAYSQVYPEGPYPIPSPEHPCAKRWIILKNSILYVIKARLENSRQIAAPRWWSRGGPSERVGAQAQNPIPGSVGYNGYSHGGVVYQSGLSGGPGPYLANPPPVPPPPPLPIDIECEVICGDDDSCYLDCVLQKAKGGGSRVKPFGTQRRWAGFRSPRRFDGQLTENPGACCSGCAGKPGVGCGCGGAA